jgi:hypothetical protein
MVVGQFDPEKCFQRFTAPSSQKIAFCIAFISALSKSHGMSAALVSTKARWQGR